MSEPAAKYGSNRTIDIGGGADLDLDILLRTRLLVQANSGGGKSWLLRRLAEQMFGKLQVIIIDPEGEFATLREQFGYVLVGKGGETPADTRSAALVAHKLLELNASAVCDLYEMRSDARHEWVAKFLEALVDAPKRLWHPTLIVLDEAHMFCPERNSGESAASPAVVDLCTRGRKRGFAAVLATQRLGKLRKDAAAELGNVLVGRTTLDIDRERAADCLGITKAAKPAFFAEIKVLEDGQFYALGRAISIDRVLVKVGPVRTTHPEPGSSRHSAAPPPAPEKIRALLPKLADLPKEAEAKARTEAELRQEINGLQARIRQLEHAALAAEVKTVEVPVLQPEQIVAWRSALKGLTDTADRLDSDVRVIRSEAERLTAALAKAQHRPAPTVPRATVRDVPKRTETRAAAANGGRQDVPAGALTGALQNAINAIAWWRAIGVEPVQKARACVVAGLSPKASTFGVYLSELAKLGHILTPQPGMVQLSDTGIALAEPQLPDGAGTVELHDAALRLLEPQEARAFEVIYDAYPADIGRKEVAERMGLSTTASTAGVYISGVMKYGIIEASGRGMLRAASWLFPG